MKRVFFISFVVITVLFLTNACKDDDVIVNTDDTSITRPIDLALPFVNGHFKAIDLLERINDTTYITTTEDGLIQFQYNQDISSEWNDIVKLDEIEFDQTYPIANNKKSAPGDTLTYTNRIRVNLNPMQRFDSLTFATAMMNMNAQVPNGVTGNYKISFPELKSPEGEVLSFNGDFSSDDSDSKPADGYQLIFKHAPDSSYFTIKTQLFNLNFNGNGGNASFGVGITMSNITPEVVFGFFGQVDALNTSNVLDFDFFKDFEFVDVIQLKGAQFKLDIDNYFGVPIRATIDSAIFERTTTNDRVELNFSGTNQIPIESATYAETIVPTNNVLKIDEANSNLDDAINLYADKITYGITATINPDGEQSTNFVTRRNKIEGVVGVVLPFTFRIRDFERTDTMKFDIKDQIDSTMANMIEYAALNFSVDNGFPFDLEANVYGANQNYDSIATIFSDYICKSGQVNTDGKVTAPTNNKFQILLENTLIQKLYDEDNMYLLIQFKVNSGGEDQTYVQLYDDYAIDFSLNFEMQSGEISQ